MRARDRGKRLGRGPGVVVTNAHVVAGESDTTVQLGGNPPNLPAHALDFDPHDDIAILRVPGLNARPLTLASDPKSGESAAILGYPLDGPFDAEPGRIGPTQVVSTEDAYGKGPCPRSIASLRGLVRPGNSGGPLVDAAGQVVATVFAAITGGRRSPARDGFAFPTTIWFASSSSLGAVARQVRRAPASAPAEASAGDGDASLNAKGRAVVCTPPARRLYAPGRP